MAARNDATNTRSDANTKRRPLRVRSNVRAGALNAYLTMEGETQGKVEGSA